MLSSTVILVAFVTIAHSFCDHGTYFNPAVEDYVADSSWGYDGDNGPTNWFSCCRQENELCSTGKTQSPVNFAESATIDGSGYVMNIPTDTLQVKHLGHTVEVSAPNHVPFGNITFGGEIWDLLQFHFHTPSEHRIKSEHYPVEVHFVHQFRGAIITKLAVVAILFEVSFESIPIRLPWESLLAYANLNAKIPKVGDVTTTPRLDFASVVGDVAKNKVYRYQGSLTTPPCSQEVQFIVSEQRVSLGWAYYNNLKALIKYNSRPVQNTLGCENAISMAAKDLTTKCPTPPVCPPPCGGKSAEDTDQSEKVDDKGQQILHPEMV